MSKIVQVQPNHYTRMTHADSLPTKAVGFSLLVVAILVSSCELLNPAPECPEPKYYPFTEADKQWQNFTAEKQWVFENQHHQRRTYRISRIQSDVKKPLWVSGSRFEYLDYHLDYWGMTWERTDSVSRAGYFWLRRIPVYQNYNRSRLSAEVIWEDYIGQHNDTGGFNPGYLNFGDDLTKTNFRELSVKGIVYRKVTSFQASNIAITRLAQYNSKLKTVQVDYDQSAGVVRFRMLNGDVWERMP